MKNVKAINRPFKTIEELRGAIVRRHMDDQHAVIFVGPKAMAEIISKMPKDVVVVNGVWVEWPQVMAVKIDGTLHSFGKALDGEEIYIYELDI